MWRAIAGILLVAALAPCPTSAAERATAAMMLPYCRNWLKIVVDKQVLYGDLVTTGLCGGFVLGTAEALVTDKTICPPAGVSTAQMVQMVVQEMEQHPERLHEPFIAPTETVLIRTWSCAKAKFGPIPPN